MTLKQLYQNDRPTPGDVLAYEMRVRNLSFSQLVKTSGLCIDVLWRLRDGHQIITQKIADRLDKVFGHTPQFWINLQQNYDS